MRQVEAQAHAMCGREFLLTSPEQVARVLYEDLRLVPPSEALPAGTSGGGSARVGSRSVTKKHPSTSEQALQQLAQAHALPALILRHRKLMKLCSTYCEGLLKEATASNPAAGTQASDTGEGREGGSMALGAAGDVWTMHCRWNQCNTGTGRLSSSRPNLQSLPKSSSSILDEAGGDGALEVNVRASFCSLDPGRTTLLAVDYSQIEMRVLAHCCADDGMVALFEQESGDIYRLLSGQVFGKPAAEVTTEERQQAKVVALGIVYGMGPADMARKLALSLDEAMRLRERFLATFPGIRRFMEGVKGVARQRGAVRSLAGRRRPLPDMTASHAGRRAYAERQSVNTVVQGTAADLMKAAMLTVSEHLAQWARAHPEAPPPRLLVQIHDELLLEVPGQLECFREVAALVRWCMEQDVHRILGRVLGLPECAAPAAPGTPPAVRVLRAPLSVNMGVGRTWGQLRPVPAHALLPEARP